MNEIKGKLSVLFDMFTLLFTMLLLSVPYLFSATALTTVVFPNATLGQQAIGFILIAVVTLATCAAAIVLWAIGCFVLSMMLLDAIWTALG